MNLMNKIFDKVMKILTNIIEAIKSTLTRKGQGMVRNNKYRQQAAKMRKDKQSNEAKDVKALDDDDEDAILDKMIQANIINKQKIETNKQVASYYVIDSLIVDLEKTINIKGTKNDVIIIGHNEPIQVYDATQMKIKSKILTTVGDNKSHVLIIRLDLNEALEKMGHKNIKENTTVLLSINHVKRIDNMTSWISWNTFIVSNYNRPEGWVNGVYTPGEDVNVLTMSKLTGNTLLITTKIAAVMRDKSGNAILLFLTLGTSDLIWSGSLVIQKDKMFQGENKMIDQTPIAIGVGAIINSNYSLHIAATTVKTNIKTLDIKRS